MRGAIQRIAPETQFLRASAFSPTSLTPDPKNFPDCLRRSAIVAFVRTCTASPIRCEASAAAPLVVLGALSPRTACTKSRSTQSAKWIYDRHDAIGMGINMDVDHVASRRRKKFDGAIVRSLRPESRKSPGRADAT